MKIMVFAAHADDLELAMGGTVKRWTDKGYQVDLILLDAPVNLLPMSLAADLLGYNYIPLNITRDCPEREVIAAIDIDGYDLMVTHWKEDYHHVHQKVHRIAKQLARGRTTDVWYMNSPPYRSEYRDFIPNIFVGFDSSHDHAKHSALHQYGNNIKQRWINEVHLMDEYWSATSDNKCGQFIEVFMLDRQFISMENT